MNVMQPSSSLELDLGRTDGIRLDTDPEAFIAKRLAESPTGEIRLMESILERENMQRALRRVRRNGGAPGIDGMTVDELPRYLRRHWDEIKAELLAGVYKPQPVRQKEIPKPDGGVRLLGIPTVLDRLIQQATAQVLQAIWDHTFSESSYGFRPGRSQHMAIRKAQDYIKDGCRWVVDLDLEKFFDRVNHDRLMCLHPDPFGEPIRHTHPRQASTEADRLLPKERHHGRWAVRTIGRGDATRWPAFPIVVKHRARRARQGA